MVRGVDVSRGLLFGLLAMRTGLIGRDEMVAALSDRDRTPADALVASGSLTPPQRELVDALTAEHLGRHGGDPGASLASLTAGVATRERVARIGDPDLTASLASVGSATPRDEGDDAPTVTLSAADGQASAGGGDVAGHRFRILRPHARGGLGEVSVALDNELNREVALKQIQERFADDPASRARFVREAEVTGNLEHPGVIPVYALGIDAVGRPCYAMRFIRGESLKEAIAGFHGEGSSRQDAGRRSLDLRKLLRRFTDVCNAVEYAHGRGVVHRDIKPANVMVGPYGETLVVDWGLAKVLGRSDALNVPGEGPLLTGSAGGAAETMPGSVVGTPGYMSPEQAAGDLDGIGPASDVYSLGAMLYCLLTGRAPFVDPDILQVLRAVKEGEFSRPRQVDPSIDPALEAVCLKAMATRPNDRYPAARALGEDLDRWLADEPVTARREPLAERARRWLKRRRTVAAAAAASVLVGIFGLAAVLAVQAQANGRLWLTNAKLDAAVIREREKFDVAMEAIRTFHTGVSSDVLLKRAELSALRGRLLDSAREFYGKLLAMLKDQPDRRSRVALGKAYDEVGGLTGEIGSRAEALKFLEQGLALREALAAEPDAGPDDVLGLADELHQVGYNQLMTGRSAEAIHSFSRRKQIMTGLVSSNPDNSTYRTKLADTVFQIAVTLHSLSRFSEAEALYREAAGIYEPMLIDHPGNQDLLRSLEKTYRSIATLCAGTGRLALALEWMERGRSVGESLVKAAPSDAEFRAQLARSDNDLGAVLFLLGRFREAQAAYGRARDGYGAVLRSSPNVTTYRNSLAMTQYNLAEVLLRAGRPAEARAAAETGRELSEALVQANPGVYNFQNVLAAQLTLLGEVCRAEGRFEEALQAHERARAIREAALKANPDLSLVLPELKDNLIAIGRLERRAGRAGESRAAYARAREVLERLIRKSPSQPSLRADLAGMYLAVGGLEGETGRTALALQSLEEGRSILESLVASDPAGERFLYGLAEYHIERAATCRHAGREADSAAAALDAASLLDRLPARSADQLFDLAVLRARLARIAGDRPDAGAQVDAALDALRRASIAGYRDVTRVSHEPDLELLRSRPGFRDLMMDLEFPAQPFGERD